MEGMDLAEIKTEHQNHQTKCKTKNEIIRFFIVLRNITVDQDLKLQGNWEGSPTFI